MQDAKSNKRTFGLDMFRDTYPTSWYPALRSRELKRGKVKALRIAGLDLVAFRTESGKAHVMDMHCAHMGASLARGSVVGECIECPFHHWRYDATGTCAHIPYMEAAKIPKAARIQSYPVLERFDTIYFYNGESPAFSLPDMPEYHDPAFLVTFSEIPIPAHQLAFMENSVDYMHFVYLHGIGADRVSCDVTKEQPGTIEFRVLMEGARYGIAKLYSASEIGARSLFVSPNTNYGSLEHNGKLVARWILSTSPVDASHTRVFATWLFRRLPRSLRLFDPIYRKLAGLSFDRAVLQDIKLSWQDMKPEKRRAWVADDSQIQKFHSYYRSFIPEHVRGAPPAMAEHQEAQPSPAPDALASPPATAS